MRKASELSAAGATAADIRALWGWAQRHGRLPGGLLARTLRSPYQWKSVLADLQLEQREQEQLRRHRGEANAPEWAQQKTEPMKIEAIRPLHSMA